MPRIERVQLGADVCVCVYVCMRVRVCVPKATPPHTLLSPFLSVLFLAVLFVFLVLCPLEGDTPQRGIVVLGDSASAHFHVPPEYMEPQLIHDGTYQHIEFVLENEFDW